MPTITSAVSSPSSTLSPVVSVTILADQRKLVVALHANNCQQQQQEQEADSHFAVTLHVDGKGLISTAISACGRYFAVFTADGFVYLGKHNLFALDTNHQQATEAEARWIGSYDVQALEEHQQQFQQEDEKHMSNSPFVSSPNSSSNNNNLSPTAGRSLAAVPGATSASAQSSSPQQQQQQHAHRFHPASGPSSPHTPKQQQQQKSAAPLVALYAVSVEGGGLDTAVWLCVTKGNFVSVFSVADQEDPVFEQEEEHHEDEEATGWKTTTVYNNQQQPLPYVPSRTTSVGSTATGGAARGASPVRSSPSSPVMKSSSSFLAAEGDSEEKDGVDSDTDVVENADFFDPTAEEEPQRPLFVQSRTGSTTSNSNSARVVPTMRAATSHRNVSGTSLRPRQQQQQQQQQEMDERSRSFPDEYSGSNSAVSLTPDEAGDLLIPPYHGQEQQQFFFCSFNLEYVLEIKLAHAWSLSAVEPSSPAAAPMFLIGVPRGLLLLSQRGWSSSTSLEEQSSPADTFYPWNDAQWKQRALFEEAGGPGVASAAWRMCPVALPALSLVAFPTCISPVTPPPPPPAPATTAESINSSNTNPTRFVSVGATDGSVSLIRIFERLQTASALWTLPRAHNGSGVYSVVVQNSPNVSVSQRNSSNGSNNSSGPGSVVVVSSGFDGTVRVVWSDSTNQYVAPRAKKPLIFFNKDGSRSDPSSDNNNNNNSSPDATLVEDSLNSEDGNNEHEALISLPGLDDNGGGGAVKVSSQRAINSSINTQRHLVISPSSSEPDQQHHQQQQHSVAHTLALVPQKFFASTAAQFPEHLPYIEFVSLSQLGALKWWRVSIHFDQQQQQQQQLSSSSSSSSCFLRGRLLASWTDPSAGLGLPYESVVAAPAMSTDKKQQRVISNLITDSNDSSSSAAALSMFSGGLSTLVICAGNGWAPRQVPLSTEFSLDQQLISAANRHHFHRPRATSPAVSSPQPQQQRARDIIAADEQSSVTRSMTPLQKRRHDLITQRQAQDQQQQQHQNLPHRSLTPKRTAAISNIPVWGDDFEHQQQVQEQRDARDRARIQALIDEEAVAVAGSRETSLVQKNRAKRLLHQQQMDQQQQPSSPTYSADTPRRHLMRKSMDHSSSGTLQSSHVAAQQQSETIARPQESYVASSQSFFFQSPPQQQQNQQQYVDPYGSSSDVYSRPQQQQQQQQSFQRTASSGSVGSSSTTQQQPKKRRERIIINKAKPHPLQHAFSNPSHYAEIVEQQQQQHQHQQPRATTPHNRSSTTGKPRDHSFAATSPSAFSSLNGSSVSKNPPPFCATRKNPLPAVMLAAAASPGSLSSTTPKRRRTPSPVVGGGGSVGTPRGSARVELRRAQTAHHSTVKLKDEVWQKALNNLESFQAAAASATTSPPVADSAPVSTSATPEQQKQQQQQQEVAAAGTETNSSVSRALPMSSSAVVIAPPANSLGSTPPSSKNSSSSINTYVARNGRPSPKVSMRPGVFSSSNDADTRRKAVVLSPPPRLNPNKEDPMETLAAREEQMQRLQAQLDTEKEKSRMMEVSMVEQSAKVKRAEQKKQQQEEDKDRSLNPPSPPKTKSKGCLG